MPSQFDVSFLTAVIADLPFDHTLITEGTFPFDSGMTDNASEHAAGTVHMPSVERTGAEKDLMLKTVKAQTSSDSLIYILSECQNKRPWQRVHGRWRQTRPYRIVNDKPNVQLLE